MKSTPKFLVPTLLASAAVAVALLSMFAVRGNAAEQMSEEAKALAKLDDEWSTSAASRDPRRVASLYAPDANAYPPNDTTAVGAIAAGKVWAAYFADPTFTISWKATYAEVAGILGYTSGTYHDSFKGKDGKVVSEKGKYLCVWKKQTDGSWMAIHDMWNTDSK